MRRVVSILIALLLLAAPLCLAEGGEETPAASPAATMAEAPTAEPAPSPEPTPAPQASALPDAAQATAPGESVSPEPAQSAEPAESAESTETAEPVDEAAESPEPSVLPTPNPDDEAWTMLDDSTLASGLLKDVLDQCAPGATVYIQSDAVVFAMDYTAEMVEEVAFLPDPVKFEADKFRVVLSDAPPEGMAVQDEEHDYLYAWVEEIVLPTAEPAPKPTPESPEMEIRVEAEGYVPGAWSNVAPVFTLSGIPADDERHAYAVIAYDERFIILSGNTFTAKDEGTYELRFVILDGIGDVVAKSAKYTLQLDFTPPAYVSASMVENSYKKYDLYSEDARSGIAGYSNDGGVTWVAPNESGAARFKGAPGDVIAMGMLLAMDGAGNVAAYMNDFYLPVKSSGGGGGGGGGGSGNDSDYSHSPAGDPVDLNPYNALPLTLSDQPMAELTMGDTLLPLEVRLLSAEGFDIPVDYQATFTAALAVWGGAPDEDEDAEPDTLVLTVTDDPKIEGVYAYAFSFNGLVYRMLQNSGIDYLMFRVGDDVAAFSTAGFTAGTEYARLKEDGVSTKEFDYEAVLEGDKAAPEAFRMLLSVTVNDGGVERYYDVSQEEGGTMYCYDVQVGPAEMMDVPFGAWDLVPPDAQ